jgi:hypothetical protein
MSSINRWLNEMPSLKNKERLLCILYTLGVATREQLEVITGWTAIKVRDRIKELRDQVPIPEYHRLQKQMLEQAKKENNITELDLQKLEAKVAKTTVNIEKKRSDWVTILQPNGAKGISYYTLGHDGIVLAKEIRREYIKQGAKQKAKTQTDHFYGTNEVLCRLRRKECIEDDWMSSGEAQQDLHYYWNREHAGKKIPYRPDALLRLDDDRYYIEFDTGSESNGRLRGRFNNCLKLYNHVTDLKRDRLPNEIIWVCRTAKRKERIEQIAKEIVEDYKTDQMKKIVKDVENDASFSSTKEKQQEINKRFAAIRVPTSYCFLEGEDTDFLLGETEATPFWK